MRESEPGRRAGRLVSMAAIVVLTGLAATVVPAQALNQGGRFGRAGGLCLCGSDVEGAEECFQQRLCAAAEPCDVNADCNPSPGGYCIPDSVSGCDTPGFVGTCADQIPDDCDEACDLDPSEFPLPLCSGAGSGRCSFAKPRKAKKYQTRLVAAFVSCGNPGGLSLNTATEDGVPACQPPTTFDTANGRPGGPTAAWLWDDEDDGGRKSEGSLQLKPTRNKCTPADFDANGDCVNPPDLRSSGDVAIQLKLNRIEDGTGALAGLVTPSEGTLATLTRATLKDRVGGAMTVIDFPAPFPIPMNRGSAKLKTTANTLLNNLALGDLPDCTSLELISISVLDPNGNTFASPGILLPEIPGGD